MSKEFEEIVLKKLESLEENTTSRFNELEEKTASKFNELEEKTASKFNELEEKTASRFNELEEKTASRFNELEEKTISRFNELEKSTTSRFNELEKSTGARLDALEEITRKMQKENAKRFGEIEIELKDTREIVKNLSENFAKFDYEINKKIDTLFDAYAVNKEKNDIHEEDIVSLNSKIFNHDIRISNLEEKMLVV